MIGPQNGGQVTKILIRAAKQAGVRKFVQVSITNASESSRFPYFRGKRLVERAIVESKLSYAIIRPAVIFGAEDILINNIAYFLRRFPLFAVFGTGGYRLQPIFVEDFADLAVESADRGENLVLDAVGPETYTFEDLVRLVRRTVQSNARIIHVSRSVGFLLCRLLGYFFDDVVLTRDEIEALMSNLLVSQGSPAGHVMLSEWLEKNVDTIGRTYASELSRHYR